MTKRSNHTGKIGYMYRRPPLSREETEEAYARELKLKFEQSSSGQKLKAVWDDINV